MFFTEAQATLGLDQKQEQDQEQKEVQVWNHREKQEHGQDQIIVK